MQTGIAIIMFWQTLGGAVFIAVAQNVFLNKLSANVSEFIPGFDVKLLFTTGESLERWKRMRMISLHGTDNADERCTQGLRHSRVWVVRTCW